MSEYIAHEEEYRGLKIKVITDNDPENPRIEWDNFGHMVCWHSRHNLGDKPYNEYSSPSAFMEKLAIEASPHVQDVIEYWENDGWNKLKGTLEERLKQSAALTDSAIQKVIDKYYIMLPLYLYEHSGITIRTGPFNDPWDSGQVGYIYASLNEVREEYSCKHVTKNIRQKVIALLESEVKVYDQYLTGDVYGYVIEKQGIDEDGEETGEPEELNSCWGFYGLDYCIQEAKSRAEWYADEIMEKEAHEMNYVFDLDTGRTLDVKAYTL